MWRNLKFFEDNGCSEIYLLLDDYLKNLTDSHNKIIEEIADQKIQLNEINKLLGENNIVPYEDLISTNQISQILLKELKISEYKIFEITAIMKNRFILDYKLSSIKFFRRVLDFYIEKENYEYCKTIQKVIDLIS